MSKPKAKKEQIPTIPGVTVCSKCGLRKDPLSILVWRYLDGELHRVKLLDNHPPGSILLGEKCAAKMSKYKWPHNEGNGGITANP